MPMYEKAFPPSVISRPGFWGDAALGGGGWVNGGGSSLSAIDGAGGRGCLVDAWAGGVTGFSAGGAAGAL